MGRPPCHEGDCDGWIQFACVKCGSCGGSPSILQRKIDKAIELIDKQYKKGSTIQYAICEFAVRLGEIRAALNEESKGIQWRERIGVFDWPKGWKDVFEGLTKPCTVTEVAEYTGLSLSSASRKLAAMEEEGLVRFCEARDGRKKVYERTEEDTDAK
jgi:DNA-binding transcriptional ArsR family regulator